MFVSLRVNEGIHCCETLGAHRGTLEPPHAVRFVCEHENNGHGTEETLLVENKIQGLSPCE